MSFFVKGKKAANSCFKCPFCSSGNSARISCKADNHTINGHKWICGEKDSKCPLLSIPSKHGRLIDADRLIAFLNTMSGQLDLVPLEAVLGSIENAPTIIEAEDTP